jgi:hypothetical protein
MASDELRLLGGVPETLAVEHCTNCGALRDPPPASARYATEVKWSSTGIFIKEKAN